MTIEDKEYLRAIYAGIAMLKMSWKKGDEKIDAEDCFLIADFMINSLDAQDEGIVAIKPKRNRKNED